MTATETLEQWAARVAPTLDAEQWRELETPTIRLSHPVFSDTKPGTERERSRALLAYRNVVSAVLSEPQRRWFLSFVDGAGYGGRGASVALRSLEDFGLAEPEGVCPTCGSVSHRVVAITDFGREVARILDARSPRR